MNLDILRYIIHLLPVHDVVSLLSVNKKYCCVDVWQMLIYRDFALYPTKVYTKEMYKQLYVFEFTLITNKTYWSSEALLLMYEIYNKDVLYGYYRDVLYDNVNIFFDIFIVIKILYKCIISSTTLTILDNYCKHMDYIDYYNTINNVLTLSNKSDVTAYETLLHAGTTMYYIHYGTVCKYHCDFNYFLSNTIVMEIVEKFPTSNKYMLLLLNKIEKLHTTLKIIHEL